MTVNSTISLLALLVALFGAVISRRERPTRTRLVAEPEPITRGGGGGLRPRSQVGHVRDATEDETRLINKHLTENYPERQRREQKRLKHDSHFDASRALLGWLINHASKRIQPASEEGGRFLVAIVVHVLPQSKRARYLEEYRAELADLPRNERGRHALSLLRGAFVLRLRGDANNKTANAASRRAKN